MLAKPNSCGIIVRKTEENVRIPFRLLNISRFPRAASPLLYLLLFLHSHGKGRPEGRPFLVRRITNVIKWHQTYFGGPKLPVNQKELSVMSTYETLYLMIAFATLIVMMLK